MDKVKLGKSPYYVSRIALGTVQFGIDYGFDKMKTQYEVDSILDCAARNGISFIDTAREYGDSEIKIGGYISRHKNDFIIATKIKKISQNQAASKGLQSIILDSIEESKKALQLKKLDVLQLHQTDEYIINKEAFWDTIKGLKKDNIIGAFGVSVYDIKETTDLIENHGDMIDFFQVPYNIFDRKFEELKEVLEKASISLVSRSTFLKGIIPCEISELPPELKDLKPYKEKLQKIADVLEMSVSELAMLYTYCSEHIGSTLLGVNSPDDIERNIDTIKKYKCGEIKKIDFSDISVKNIFLTDPRKWKNF